MDGKGGWEWSSKRGREAMRYFTIPPLFVVFLQYVDTDTSTGQTKIVYGFVF